MSFRIQLSEQHEPILVVPVKLQVEGELSIFLTWFLILIFSQTGNYLLRILQVGFFSSKTVIFYHVCVLFKTWGNSLPFAAERSYFHRLWGLEILRVFFPLLLGPFERWQIFKWVLGHSLEPFWGIFHKIPLGYKRGISEWCTRCAVSFYIYASSWL